MNKRSLEITIRYYTYLEKKYREKRQEAEEQLRTIVSKEVLCLV